MYRMRLGIDVWLSAKLLDSQSLSETDMLVTDQAGIAGAPSVGLIRGT